MRAYPQVAARQKPEPLPPIAVPEAEAARLIGISARTLFTLRKECRAPRHVVIGSQVRYRVDAIREWLESQEQQANAAGGATS